MNLKFLVLDYGQCGKSGTPRESLSINPIGKWPWMASLGFHFYGDWRHACGASLISTTFVITAGHCVVNINIEEK